jgi:hypothetical protein
MTTIRVTRASSKKRKLLARIDTAMRTALLMTVVIAIWREGLLSELWRSLGF